MNFGFTEEQDLLRAEVRKFLDESSPLSEVRKITEDASGPGFSPELWKQIAELGWIGLTIDEAHGGAGLGFVDWVVVLEETGRTLFPSPLISTTLAAHAIAKWGDDAQRSLWLPRLADGTTIGTVAILEAGRVPGPEGITLAAKPEGGDIVLAGEKVFVGDAGAADVFVVAARKDGSGERVLALVGSDAPGVTVTETPGFDLTKRVGRIRFDGVRVSADAILGASNGAAVQALLDAGAVAVTAEAVGAAEAALALTVGYANDRIQFGTPIARFQGVKHPLAEMYVDVQSFKSLVYYAAWCIDEGHADAAIAAARAKAYGSDTFPQLGIDTVGLHGGIGYTWEYDAHLYLKRAKWARPAFGDADWHYERIAQMGGL